MLIVVLVQAPYSWQIWAADNSLEGYVRASVISLNILPAVVTVAVWGLAVFLNTNFVRIAAWYGVFHLWLKAIQIIAIVLAIVPLKEIASGSWIFTPSLYAFLPLAFVVWRYKQVTYLSLKEKVQACHREKGISK